MKVKVVCAGRADFEEKEVDVPQDATVGQAVKSAGFPLEDYRIFINGSGACFGEILQPGDELILACPIMGG